MDGTFIGSITDLPFFDIMFYGFGVVLSFLFVMYSLVIVGQTTALRKAVVTDKGRIVQIVSIIQLVVAIAVFIASLIY
ncbi:MAG: DUF5657 family protein [Patescibacteria group bacterium]